MPTMTQEHFDEAKRQLLQAVDSETFHIKLKQLGEIARALWSMQESPPSANRVVHFKNRTFLFRISPGSDVPPSVNVLFERCTFGEEIVVNQIRDVTFLSCIIDKMTLVHSSGDVLVKSGSIDTLEVPYSSEPFENASFNNVKISRLKVNRSLLMVIFSKCTFDSLIEFSIFQAELNKLKRLFFEQCKFICSPDFMKSAFSKDVRFMNCSFLNLDGACGMYYRDLKHKMSDNHDDMSASLFGGLELRCKHTEEGKWSWDWLLGECYLKFNNFGLDPYRPAMFLFWQFFAALLSFAILHNLGIVFSPGSPAVTDPLGQIFYLAFLSILGPLRLLGKFEAVSFTEVYPQILLWIFTLSSSLIWFFLILAVRRRFRVN